jgi:O-antigen/teichoic acid export membrane protein
MSLFDNNKFLKHEFTRNFLTLFTGATISQVVGLLVYPILTRQYQPVDFGTFALFLYITNILALIATGKYELAIILPKKDNEAIHLVILPAVISFLFSIAVLVILVFVKKYFGHLFENKEILNWFYFIPISIFMASIYNILQYWANRLKLYKQMTSAEIGLNATAAGTKVLLGGLGFVKEGLITGRLVSQLLSTILLIKLISRNLFILLKKSINKAALYNIAAQYSVFPKFRMFHYLVNILSSSLPIFIFSHWFSVSVVGYYSLAITVIHRPVVLISSSISKVLYQGIAEKFNYGKDILPDIRKIVIKLVFFGIVPFVAVGILAPLLFKIIFGQEWIESGKMLQYLIPWLFLTYIASPISFIPDLLLKQKIALAIEICYFAARFIVLVIGILKNDLYLCLLLFGIVSFTFVGLNFSWYLYLAGKADKSRRNLSSPHD